MSEQETGSKDNGEIKETAQVESDISDISAENPKIPADMAPDPAQNDGQSLSENDDSAGDPDPRSDDSLPEFVEEALAEVENWPDGAETDEKTAAPEAKIAELEAELADSRDQLLRKAADFENFRKRMNQEKQNAIEFANQTLLLDIIPVIDDFERAILSAESSAELTELPAGKAVLEGITMIEKRLVSLLEGKWGLKRFNSAGEPFDPNRHEAMMMEKSGDIEEPVVQEEFVKGYTLKDRVIRAAKVKVLMPEDA